jgi:diketogulonate reductase-like aldo/keto reductase
MIHITVQNKKVPALGYGTYKLRDKECVASIGKALEIGYRHIDTAQIYENEAEVGAGIAASGVKRDDIFLTTKIWNSNLREGAFQKSLDESLKKLKVDHVDLLLIHWPVTDIPFAEQLKTLQQVQKEGKTTLIGISNYTVAQMKEVVEKIGAKVVTNQIEYHPYLSQKMPLDYIRAHNMFLTAYCPLANGNVKDDAVLAKIGKKYGKTVGQVTLRWLVQQENVAAIPKAASEKHIRENFEIFDFKLELSEMNQISALARPDGRIVNPGFAPKWDKAA